MKLAFTLAAIIAVVSAAVLPRALPREVYIEAIAVSGPKAQVSGLYALQYHSGAGLNNIDMVPFGLSSYFHYNMTSKGLQRYETYFYALGVPNIVPQDPRLRKDYRLVTFNVGGQGEARFSVGQPRHFLTLLNKPKNFQHFAVCNTKTISDDEPVSSYQQLVYRVGAPVAGCTDVYLRLTGFQ